MMAEQKQVIPEGYKQTEIGVVPADWDVIYVKSITLDHKQGYYTKDAYTLDGIKLARITDLKNPSVDFESMPSLSISNSDYQQYKIKTGDVLLARSGAIGRYGIVTKDEIAVFGSYIIRFNFDQNKISNDFFGFVYQSQQTLKQLLAITQGSSNININAGNVKSLLIQLPSQKEQTAITNALSDVDALITELEKLIAKKQAIKTATMQQLLTGKTRLPEFALRDDGTPKGYKASELGEIPEDWEVVAFGDFIRGVIDNRGKTPPLVIDGFPMVEVNAIYKQGKSPNLEKVIKYVSKNIYESWFRDGHPEIGNILIVTVGSAGETSFVDKEGFCIAQNLIGLKIDSIYNSEFVYYITRSVPFKKQVDAVLMGAVQPSLKVPHLKNFLFPVPKNNKYEQNEIGKIFTDIDEEIQTLQQRLNKTRQIKQGMMQELLTGKTRLVKPEVTA